MRTDCCTVALRACEDMMLDQNFADMIRDLQNYLIKGRCCGLAGLVSTAASLGTLRSLCNCCSNLSQCNSLSKLLRGSRPAEDFLSTDVPTLHGLLPSAATSCRFGDSGEYHALSTPTQLTVAVAHPRSVTLLCALSEGGLPYLTLR